jgi:hypothetical protein
MRLIWIIGIPKIAQLPLNIVKGRDANMHVSWYKYARLLGLFALTFTLQTSAQQFKTFDAPGAGTAPGTGTFPVGINAQGTVTGVVNDGQGYGDYQGSYHGFVLGADSKLITFDVPDAFPGWTVPTAINDLGEIVGFFANISNCAAVDIQPVAFCYHGFLRKPNGTFTVFDAPADTPPGYSDYMGIVPQSINNFGVITGWYYMRFNATELGFYLTPNGRFTVLGGEAYEPNSINDFGVIVGTTSSSPFDPPFQGFITTRTGMLTFQVPGGMAYDDKSNDFGGGNVFINDFGVVAGNSMTGAGFLRAPDGKITFFPGFFVAGLNIFANTTGAFDGHAVIRYSNGKLIVLNMPVAEKYSEGTGINARDVVTGSWEDSAGVSHGFIWKNR